MIVRFGERGLRMRAQSLAGTVDEAVPAARRTFAARRRTELPKNKPSTRVRGKTKMVAPVVPKFVATRSVTIPSAFQRWAKNLVRNDFRRMDLRVRLASG